MTRSQKQFSWYVIARMALAILILGVLAGRSSIGAQDDLVFGRYSPSFVVFLLLYAVVFAINTGLLLAWQKRLSWALVGSQGAIVMLQMFAMSHFILTGHYWIVLGVVLLILFTLESCIGLFCWSKQTDVARTAVVAKTAMAGLSVCFCLLTVELGLKVLFGPGFGLYGLVDNFPYRFNAHGLRGAEFTREKPDGEYRILMLGDSVTFGQAVGVDDTFSARLEAKLGASKHQVRVINAGERGTDVVTQAAQLSALMAFEPDLVIQTFFVNDIATASGEQVSWMSLVDRSLLGWSLVYGGSRVAIARLMAGDELADLTVDDNRQYRGAPWERGVAAMQDIVRQCHDGGASVFLGLFPSLAGTMEPYHLAAMHEQVMLAAKDCGYDVVMDLQPAFAETGKIGKDFHALPFDWHPSPEAHELVAAVYFAQCQALLVGPDKSKPEVTP